jgi:hypothetical protein
VSDQSLEIRDNVSFSPRQRTLNAQVVVVRAAGERFEILYVQGEESMLQAADAIQTLLDQCEVNITFQTIIYVPGENHASSSRGRGQ